MASDSTSEEEDEESPPVTLEQATEEIQDTTEEKSEHLKGLPNYGAKENNASSDLQGLEEKYEDVEDISVTVPDFLVDEKESDSRRGGGIDLPEPGGRRPGPIDIPDLDDLDNQALLQVLARIQLAQLSTLLDVADYLAPLTSITVSGTNIIENEDVPQPVVPLSDDQSIPTRSVFIKASSNNTSPLAFGDDEVDPDSGFILSAGESIVKEIDLRGETLYMASKKEGQEVELLGMI